MGTPEDDTVFHVSFDGAAGCDQGVLDIGSRSKEGRTAVLDIGEYRTMFEQHILYVFF